MAAAELLVRQYTPSADTGRFQRTVEQRELLHSPRTAALGYARCSVYNGLMERTAEAIGQKQRSADRMSEALATLGELLAAVSDVLEGLAIIRRRGPTRARRNASTIVAFLLGALISNVRSCARAVQQRNGVLLSALPHYLRHPPQSWAAP